MVSRPKYSHKLLTCFHGRLTEMPMSPRSWGFAGTRPNHGGVAEEIHNHLNNPPWMTSQISGRPDPDWMRSTILFIAHLSKWMSTKHEIIRLGSWVYFGCPGREVSQRIREIRNGKLRKVVETRAPLSSTAGRVSDI